MWFSFGRHSAIPSTPTHSEFFPWPSAAQRFISIASQRSANHVLELVGPLDPAPVRSPVGATRPLSKTSEVRSCTG